jgi:hypothetical protein
VTSRFDFNRDGRVNAVDVLLSRNSAVGVVLRLITPSAATQSAAGMSPVATGRSAYVTGFSETTISYRPANLRLTPVASEILD